MLPAAASHILIYFDHVIIDHIQCGRSVGFGNTMPVEHKSQCAHHMVESRAVRVFEACESTVRLDFKMHLVREVGTDHTN